MIPLNFIFRIELGILVDRINLGYDIPNVSVLG